MYIILPDNLAQLNALSARVSDYREIIISTSSRDFPFYLSGQVGEGNELKLMDVPTTLLTAKIAIEKIFDADFLARPERRERVESREISNFAKQLADRAEEGGYGAQLKFCAWDEV